MAREMKQPWREPGRETRPAPGSDRSFVLVAAAALTIAALMAYAKSFSAPLILDDWATVLHNPEIRRVWPLWSMFTPSESTGVGGRPVANISFVLNYAVSGDSLAGFHAVNLAIHLFAGLALFGVIRRTLLLPVLREKFGRDAAWLGLMVGCLWTLHPLLTESVTYISQRTESLMGLFYFLSLYGFVRAVEDERSGRWLLFSLGCCVTGMGTKEGMVTAPVMILLFDLVFVSRTMGELWRRRGLYYAALAATWLLLAVLMRGVSGRGVGFGHGLSVWSNLLIEARAVVGYATLGLWPSPLVFDYGTDLGTPGLAEAACALFLAGFGLWVLLALRRFSGKAYLGAWFLITLAPTSSMVPIPLQPISENRAYVPLAAVITAVVLGARWAVGRRAPFILAAGSLAMVVLTSARNATYRSEISIWTDTVAKRPGSSRAHNNLGFAWLSAGRLAEAKTEIETALRIKEQYPDAHVNLSSVLGQLGDVDGAFVHSRRATQLDPRNANAFYNLGVASAQKGDIGGAIAAYEAAVRLQPGLLSAQGNLGILLLRSGRVKESIEHCEIAVKGNPGLVDARLSLACGLAMSGRAAEAMPHFQEVIRTNPGHLDAQLNYGVTLAQMGRSAEAIALFEAILKANPGATVVREVLERLKAAPPSAPPVK